MSDFEKWFKTTEAYKMMEEQNYFKMNLFFFVTARNQYSHSGVQVAYLTWQHQQAEINQHQLEIHALGEANLNQAMMLAKKQEEIDSLKAQLNNMETCCIEKKKRVDELQGALNEVKEWKSHPVGYEASFGSSGVRDFYKDLAGKTLRGEHE